MSHGRKPRQPRWPANNLAHESTVHKLRTFDADESAELVNEARMAWHHLTHGKGTKDHFDTLGNALNATLILSEPVGQQAVDIAVSAQLAAVSMQQRYHRTGSFGADAAALEHVPAGLDLFEQLMGFSNPLQLVRAVEQSWQRIREGDVLASAHPKNQQRTSA
jgi:hypothetical protein